MQITEIRLAGFKSFVEPTRAPVEAGLTGVVGPNGCGKSNLLEAVRWVMGATSAKAMRAGDMDDVIFAGAGARPPREHAEVTLVLDIAGAALPEALTARLADAGSLEITRRIRRGQGSTYRINGREARAKDVQLLFADAATGANSPALVRQGQISELISAKPENRRRILEDAAGIAGLHVRRHEADLKLKAAEANLETLDQHLKDLTGQTGQLKRQARQAERYKLVSEEIRQVEALLILRRWRDALEALAAAEAESRAAARAQAEAAETASIAARVAQEAEAALAPAREEDLIAAAVLRRLETAKVGLERDALEAEAALERLRGEAARLGAGRDAAGRARADAKAAITRLEIEAATLGAVDADAGEVDRLSKEAATAEAARKAAADALDGLRRADAAAEADAAGLRAAERAARERLARAQARLAAAPIVSAVEGGLSADLAQAEAALQAAAAAERAAQDRAAAAEEAAQAADCAADGARAALSAAEKPAAEIAAEMKALAAVLATPAKAPAYPPVLDHVSVAEGFERAFAAALGEDVLAALDPKAPAAWRGASAAPARWGKGVTPLSDHVAAPPALAARLAQIGVLGAEAAADLQGALTPGQRLVSPEGDLWRWDGFVRRACAPSPVSTRLEQASRRRALAPKLAAAEARLVEARTTWDRCAKDRDGAQTALRGARQALPQAARALADAQAKHANLTARAAALDAQAKAAKAARTSAEAEATEAAEALAARQSALARAPTPSSSDARRAAETLAEETRRDAAQAAAAHTALSRASEARAARREAISQELSQWRARAKEAEARIASLERDASRAAADLAKAKDAPAAARAALAQQARDLAAAEARAATARQSLATRDARLRETAASAREAAHAYAAAEAAHGAAHDRLRGAQSCVQREEAAARAFEPEGQAALVQRAGAAANGPLKAAPLVEIEKRLERLAGERDAAGPVNLRAEEELGEALAQAARLESERADVAQAIGKLRHAIGRLNGEARARLLRAFDVIDAHFTRLFTTLFEGGEAKLRLTDADDPLAAGLEILASPPGKRLSTLSLMSGGEQALTATALIFAVFLANPAPLCVLDEVDAPLDDANVDRFCRLLEAMRADTATRFIVITHNPVTMARMDRLYGVTMAERGVSQLVSVDLQRAAAMAAA